MTRLMRPPDSLPEVFLYREPVDGDRANKPHFAGASI